MKTHTLWLGLTGAVAVALVAAVVATRPDPSAASLLEVRPVTVTGTALPAFGDGPDAAVGRPAPVLNGASFDGTPVSVAKDGRGKVIVFVAHWCPHCQREVPLLVPHLPALPADVDVVAVATSTNPDRPNYPPSRWLDRVGWPAPVLADDAAGTAATAYGLSAFPFFVAVDPAGNVVARTSGEITTAELDRLARAASG